MLGVNKMPTKYIESRLGLILLPHYFQAVNVTTGRGIDSYKKSPFLTVDEFVSPAQQRPAEIDDLSDSYLTEDDFELKTPHSPQHVQSNNQY